MPENFTRIEVEKFFPPFTTNILLLEKKLIETKLWILITFIGCYHQLSNNSHSLGEHLSLVGKQMYIILHSYIHNYYQTPLHYSLKELRFLLLLYCFAMIYFFLRKSHTFWVIEKTWFLPNKIEGCMYPWKFRENFDTSESHENWYIGVLEYAGHEFGLSFLISIISNTIASLLA